jgi:hypothetical protein
VARRIFWALVMFKGSDGSELSLELFGDEAPDLGVVAALARLQVLCRRCGVHVHLQKMNPTLEDLLELTGLRGEMTGLRGEMTGLRGEQTGLCGEWTGTGLCGEMVREPESREERFGIEDREERVDPRDSVT